MKPRPGHEREDTIQNAAHAIADLTIFAAVVEIMEGALHCPESYKAASKIIKICKAEQKRRLEEYDGFVDDVVRS